MEDLRTVSAQPHLTLGNLWSTIVGRTSQANPFPPQESLTQRSSLGDLGVGFSLQNPHGAAGDTLMVVTADNDGEIKDPETGAIISEDGNGDGYADVGCGLCYTSLGEGAVRVNAGSTVADRTTGASPVGCNPTCLFTPATLNGAEGQSSVPFSCDVRPQGWWPEDHHL